MQKYIRNPDETRYNDIIALPHHISRYHPHMSHYNRGAQFAPFAALSGFEEAVRETERRVNKRWDHDH